ncbi:MAG TPA: hypothetical protein VH278_14010 [Burkholderiaceae bacterium]|nr:hypothetical protein [Burkholderiaceae bacterium]
MTGPAAGRCARSLWLIALWCVLVGPRAALANGADLPAEIPLQGFVKPEKDHLHLLVRVPLVLLTSFALPKRGPGYLDLANIDPALQRATASSGRQIELREDGALLVPDQLEGRISLLSDHSFQSYQAAFDHLNSPPLPPETDLFWNQGFFDVQLDYPIRSARSHFSIDTNIAPELGQRLKLQLEFLPVDGPPLHYRLPGRSGRIALDPRWYEAAWLFVKLGFFDGFAFDRLVFLVCLVAPFRHFRSLLAVVLVFSATQALSSTAVAVSSSADSPFLTALSSATLAAAIVLLALGNLATPSLRRRWFVGAIVGAGAGFGLGEQLADALQFAGSSTVASIGASDVGSALAQVVTLAFVRAALRLLLSRRVGAAFGLVVLSAILGHMAWHWMVDQGHELLHQFSHGGLSASLNTAAPCIVAGLLVGAVAFFLPRGFGAAPLPSLRTALYGRADEHRN